MEKYRSDNFKIFCPQYNYIVVMALITVLVVIVVQRFELN